MPKMPEPKQEPVEEETPQSSLANWDILTVGDIESTTYSQLPDDMLGDNWTPQFDGRKFIGDKKVFVQHNFSDGRTWNNRTGFVGKTQKEE